VETSAELSQNTTEHEHSGRDWRAEIRELKRAYKNLSLEKNKEVSALAAQKDFVWHQFKTMEKDYDSLLKKKKIEAAQATEAAQRLQQKVKELQVAAQKKDDDIARLQAEANGAKKLILVLEDKLQKLHSLASEKDEGIQKVKGGHLQASQKRKQDINGTHRKSRSAGHSQRGKSKNNAQRQMTEEDQPETSQKRQRASSLSNVSSPCPSISSV
jgi:chromosome segregation ATPase